MAFRHDFNPTSLREYDIRGVVGRTLHPADAFAIGRCFGAVVSREGGSRVAVGYDGRLSSPDLAESLVEGLKASGMNVLRVGRGPTPLLYFAAATLGTDGAVMVTGSHNPPDYNGFKMMLGRKPFFGAQHPGRSAAWPRQGDVVPVSSGKAPTGSRGHRRTRYVERRDAGLRRRRPQAARGVGPRQRLRAATCWPSSSRRSCLASTSSSTAP